MAEVPVLCSHLVSLVQGPCCSWANLGCRTIVKVVTSYLCPLGLSNDQVFPRSTLQGGAWEWKEAQVILHQVHAGAFGVGTS